MENKISKKGTKNLIDRKELILELRERLRLIPLFSFNRESTY